MQRMNAAINSKHLQLPHPFRKSIPFAIALIVLLFIAWSFFLVWTYPDDGIRNLTPTGYIGGIDPRGPTYGILHAGDLLLTIDGVPFSEALPLYKNKIIGDKIDLLIQSGDQLMTVELTLATPPLSERMQRIMPLIVALIFWIIGAGVQAFAPTSEETVLLFTLFMAITTVMVSGQDSNIGPSWSADIYNALAWFVGPLAVHLHLHFPQPAKIKGKSFYLLILYLVGFSGGLSYIIYGSSVIRSSPLFPISLSISRILLSLSFLSVVALLYYAYIHADSPGVKGKIRLVFLGGILSVLPLVMLVLLPEALFHKSLQPYALVLVWIGIFPLTYGYAIFRYHLIEIEQHVNRGATYLLVFSILVGFYLILSYTFHKILPVSVENELYFNMLLVLILALILVPIYRQVQRFVDIVFYGGWYDYRSAVTQITWGLEQITDLQFLAETVSERLVRTLRLEDTCVFLCDNNGDFSVIEVAPHTNLEGGHQKPQMPVLPRSSLQYLLKIGSEERASLVRALSEVTLSPEEHHLLNSEQVHLWVPIIGHGQVKGFLALGSKFGGDIFSAEDLDILRIIARQIAPVVENIHLVTQLRQHASELEARVLERTAELHDAKERVEAILSSVGDGVVVIDLEWIILAVNAALEKQCGFSRAELIGKKLEYFLAEENEPEIVEEIKTTLAQGDVWTGELVFRRKSGVKYDIHFTIAPVRDQHGNMVSYVGSQRDITHQKELDRLKDIFVADVSHELRTPTTNINLYLELLETASLDKIPDYVRILKDQGLLLRKLVEDILDLSRLTVGKTRKAEFTDVDINLLIDQVITAHYPLAQNNGITLYSEKLDENLFVVGDPAQLARVITNLVANAIQYTNHGKIQVKSFRNEQQVFVEVSDTGIGIADDDLEHIFERFYRGKQVRQTKMHGTGLGLAIVKEIVEMHGGKIDVQSKIGQGSIFTVSLPVFNSELVYLLEER
jgi:two-component system NtrC family sensor kinase